MKCAKIIVTYFGQRRTVHNTPDYIFNFFDKMIKNELSIQNEINTDIFIVINSIDIEKENQIIEELNNKKTNNGKIICVKRNNVGGPFGAYFQIFKDFQDQYQYWFFCEDDILIYKNGYMKEFVEFLDSDDSLGFVCLAPIAQAPMPHGGGGVGLTSTEKFLKAYSQLSIQEIMNHMVMHQSYGELEISEWQFTARFHQFGMRIANHPNFSPLCENFTKHGGQARYAHLLNEKEFIYQVGEL